MTTDVDDTIPYRAAGARGRAAIRLLAAGALILGAMPLLSRPSAADTYTNPERIVVPRLPGPPPGCPNFPTSSGCGDVAQPYPSEISVAGETGTVSDVNVTLNGLWHNDPGLNDLDIMVVAPGGTGVMLMSDACGTDAEGEAFAIDPANAITVTFDDEANEALPADTACVSGTFQPVDDEDEEFAFMRSDEFLGVPNREAGTVGPAPSITNSASPDYTTPNTALLSAFDGQEPNGAWRLYVIDDTPGTVAETPAGAIEGGWTIDITTMEGSTTTTEAPTTTTTMPEAEFCNGLAVTIAGTGGPERIDGTPGDDVIAGLGGDDQILAGAGNDTVCGGAGDDGIVGDAGNDNLYGGSGDDEIRGGLGADNLFGEEGNDTLRDSEAATTFSQRREVSTLDGGPGDDRLFGGQRTTVHWIGSGTDQVRGGLGVDIVRDAIQEGDWFDTGNQVGTSLLLRGSNTAHFLNGGIVNGGNADDGVLLFQGGTFYGGAGEEEVGSFDGGTFYGGADDDQVNFLGGAATFYGGAGDDRVDANFGGIFHGGSGNESIGSADAGIQYGGEGDDVVDRLAPPATFYGGPGTDTVVEDNGGTFVQDGPAGEDIQGR